MWNITVDKTTRNSSVRVSFIPFLHANFTMEVPQKNICVVSYTYGIFLLTEVYAYGTPLEYLFLLQMLLCYNTWDCSWKL